MRRTFSISFRLLGVSALALPVIAYFLSWGESHHSYPGITFTIASTGKDAGAYGPISLGLAVVAFVCAATALIPKLSKLSWALTTTYVSTAIFGFLLILVAEPRPGVTYWDFWKYEFEHQQRFMLLIRSYPGPNLILVGYLASLLFTSIAAVIKKREKVEADDDKAQAAAP